MKTGGPADPVVARFRFEGGGGKHQQGQPAILNTGEVLNRLPNQRGRAEVVMLGEQGLEGVLLLSENRTNHDLSQIDDRLSAWRFVWHEKEYALNEKKKPASIVYSLLSIKLHSNMK